MVASFSGGVQAELSNIGFRHSQEHSCQMSEQPKDTSSFEILSLLRSLLSTLPSDDHRTESVTRLADKYNFLIKHFLKSEVKQHAELKKARANYLTAHAGVVRLFPLCQGFRFSVLLQRRLSLRECRWRSFRWLPQG